MLRKGLFLVLFLAFMACEKASTSPEKTLLGEWAYVGTFDSRQSYDCFLCEGFEPSATLYSINFLAETNYSGRVNLLLVRGEYMLSDIKITDKGFTAGFENINMEILNKPYETEADSKVKTLLENANKVEIKTKSTDQSRDILILSSDDFEFLVFARK